MKKYTIEEFADGQKAVKIENEEQWNKLNKVHKLAKMYSINIGEYFTNNHEWCDRDWYEENSYEILEFSQLDFEDEFVVGSWYKYRRWYLKFEQVHCGIFQAYEAIDNQIMFYKYRNLTNFGVVKEGVYSLCKDLSEIQQYLPPYHPDLMKKDTFVLPEKWFVRATRKNESVLRDWRGGDHTGWGDDLVMLSTKWWADTETCKGYTEITFEEFKTHVLKESTMEKEVIGYKFKEACLKYKDQAAEIGQYSKGYDVQQYYLTEKDKTTSNGIKLLKKAGVLDLWFEPVYKPEIPTLPEGFKVNSDNKISFRYIIASYDWWRGVEYAAPDGTIVGDDEITGMELNHLIKYINYQEKL